MVCPVAMGFQLVDHDRAIHAAMAAEVALAVAIKVQPAGKNPSRHWLLPDRRPDCPALPRDVLGKPDINRDDHAHHATSADLSSPTFVWSNQLDGGFTARYVPQKVARTRSCSSA